MIITNILKTINLEELYSRPTLTRNIGDYDFPRLLYSKAGNEIRTWICSAVFWGAKRVSYLTERPGMGTALGKFGARDSYERFWQMFTKVKIKKTKIWKT